MMKQLLIAVLAGTFGAASAQADTQRVLVIPFSALNVPESQQWMTKGVQETLVADFGRMGIYSPVAFQGQVVVEDNATAARLARQASTGLAIRGAAQVVGPNVRLTAQLIDAASGETLSTGMATGPSTDLLKLEDELSAQLRGVSAAGAATVPAQPPVAQPAAAQQPQVVVVLVPTPTLPVYPVNPDYNAYSDLGYYPGFIGPVVITPGFRHHHPVESTGPHLVSSVGGQSTLPLGGFVPTLAAPVPQLPAMTPTRVNFMTRTGR